MQVYVGCYPGDIHLAERVAETARRCEGGHEVRIIQRDVNGFIPSLGPDVKVSTQGWPVTCTSMFKAFVASLRIGTMFLNLEPDAVLTRTSALNELEDEMSRVRRKWDRICMMGHWKTPPVTPDAPVEHLSGSSVYYVTPEFKDAVSKVLITKPWDLDLFFGEKLQPDQGCNTDLIRCLWRRDLKPRVLRDFPRAALIHGDKQGALLRHVEQTVFHSAA